MIENVDGTLVMMKLVIRTPNHLGDCLMALPAIRSLAQSGLDRRTFLLAPKWSEPVFSSIPDTTLIPLEDRFLHGWLGILQQRKLLRSHLFDDGIIMPPSFSSALAFALGRVTNRYGLNVNSRSPFLTHPVLLPDSSVIHRSSQYQLLVNRFAGTELPTVAFKLPVCGESSEKASHFLKDLASGKPLIAISPQAVAKSRRWGIPNYQSLALRLIASHDAAIILLGSPAEFTAGEELSAGNKMIFNLCGKTNIGDAAAVLSRCRLFIGNDSGLAHLAAAVDIPQVVLSGADNPAETSPLSDKKTVIIKNHLDCISCVKNCCPLHGDRFMRCMREISVEEVFAAATNLLNKHPS